MARTKTAWTEERKAEIRRRWDAGESKAEIMLAMNLTRGQFAGAEMRCNLQPRGSQSAAGIWIPGENHPAVAGSRTLFPSRVVDPDRGPPILVPGTASRKIGKAVTKGAWAGMPIYMLTLEERATCPATCHHWQSCYGNSMNWAARNRHGPALEDRIMRELDVLSARHLNTGYVVRLHILGDFYSVAYVRHWLLMLVLHPRLHIWGYTAWPRDSRIGSLIDKHARRHWRRFAIRFSTTKPGRRNAVTLKTLSHVDPALLPASAAKGKILVCPVETGRAESCGTCALCWAPAARNKTIAFIMHGPRPVRRPQNGTEGRQGAVDA